MKENKNLHKNTFFLRAMSSFYHAGLTYPSVHHHHRIGRVTNIFNSNLYHVSSVFVACVKEVHHFI